MKLYPCPESECDCDHRYHSRGNGSGRSQMRFDMCPSCHHD